MLVFWTHYPSVVTVFLKMVLLIFFFILILLILKIEGFFFGLNFSSLINFNLIFDFKLDLSLFFFLLILVFFNILFFSEFYMVGELFLFYYNFLIFLFVLIMGFLVYSYSFVVLVFFWDMLGLVSFFLVLFYLNFEAVNGSLVTLLSNRLGDIFLLLGFFFCFSLFSGLVGFSLFFLLTSLTKSAQFPFMGWLPKAMSAPTPVSSLVHSSTLVTAGLFLNYFFLGFFFNFLFFLIFLLGLFSLFFSSLLAVLEGDLKKVVALSTLSQIGFCFLSFSLGFYFISFFHLMSHALFKSLLFIQVGFLIFYNLGEQESRLMNFFLKVDKSLQFQLVLCLLNLSGIFFMSGFVSKHLIFDFFWLNYFGFLIILFFLLSILLTFFYSLKIFFMFFFLGNLIFLSKKFNFYFISFILYFFLYYYIYFIFVNFLLGVVIFVESEKLLLILFFSLFFFWGMKISLNEKFLKKKFLGVFYCFFFSVMSFYLVNLFFLYFFEFFFYLIKFLGEKLKRGFLWKKWLFFLLMIFLLG